MGFNFNLDLCNKKLREKILETEHFKTVIYDSYPDVKAVDECIQKLKKDLRLIEAKQLFNRDLDIELSNQYTVTKDEIKTLEVEYKNLLMKYNIPLDFKEPKWDCPICSDTGLVINNGRAIPCECTSQQRKSILLSHSNLPKKLINATFKNSNFSLYSSTEMTDKGSTYRDNAQKVFDAATLFSHNFEKSKEINGLFIEGNIGSGKSYLLGCITNMLIERNIEARYIVYIDLIESIKASFNKDTDVSSTDILRKLEEVPVLLIDDLGTEYITNFTSSTLYQIIDKRYRNNLPIVVSSNFNADELANIMGFLGERIVSRIVETCDCYRLIGDVRDQIALSKLGADQ